jgi:hypothetical protein
VQAARLPRRPAFRSALPTQSSPRQGREDSATYNTLTPLERALSHHGPRSLEFQPSEPAMLLTVRRAGEALIKDPSTGDNDAEIEGGPLS